MRSYTPGDKDHEQSIKEILAEPWMVDLLKLNPRYVHWGPFEDYMARPADDDPWHEQRRKVGLPDKKSGWEARILFKTWKEHEIELDDLNEVVNFYFSVNRDSKECEVCEGTGYHPHAMWVSETFYAHMIEKLAKRAPDDLTNMIAKYGPRFEDHIKHVRKGEGWHTNITQDEVDALVKEGRLYDFTHTFEADKGWQAKDPPYKPTAEEVNKWAAGGLGHDGINRLILVEARCKRLELPKECPECKMSGFVYTADHARVSLTYWLLHPRKGCSRGVQVADIKQSELPQVFAFLKHAAERNAQRFAKVVDVARRCT